MSKEEKNNIFRSYIIDIYNQIYLTLTSNPFKIQNKKDDK